MEEKGVVVAKDSKCERIVQYWVDKFEAGGDISVRRFKAIKRTRLKLAELSSFSGPQLPVLAIVSGLPRPVPHPKGRVAGGGDAFISELRVEFIVYGIDNENPSVSIIDHADDLWATLHGDQTTGSGTTALTLNLTVEPEDITYVLDPYFALKMVAKFQYYHTTGGI